MNEPAVLRTRSIVWTDAEAQSHMNRGPLVAQWFWAVSGPRGHMSGGESTADAALTKCYGAMQLLMDERERKDAS